MVLLPLFEAEAKRETGALKHNPESSTAFGRD